MAKEYWIIEKSEKILRGYVDNPNQYDKSAVEQALNALIDVLLIPKQSRDVLREGLPIYFGFVLQSGFYPQQFKNELKEYAHERGVELTVWEDW
jgi:hypothetical protein